LHKKLENKALFVKIRKKKAQGIPLQKDTKKAGKTCVKLSSNFKKHNPLGWRQLSSPVQSKYLTLINKIKKRHIKNKFRKLQEYLDKAKKYVVK